MIAAIGAPQIAALLILIQRGAEEIYSARNMRALQARGAREEGAGYYPVVAVTHVGWIASLFFLIPADAPTSWPLIGLYIVLQGARYWVIATLGPYWTHRIITLDEAPIVSSGAYRFLRHPNYAITIVETLLLPVAFSAVAVAIAAGAFAVRRWDTRRLLPGASPATASG